MSQINQKRRQIGLAIVGAVPAAAGAQFRVEITGVGLTQVPIGLPKFRNEDASGQALSEIVRSDLERSGQFRSVAPAAAAVDDSSQIDMPAWRKQSADSLVAGSVTRLADGRFDVRYRLWDVVRGSDLGGQSYVGVAAELRLIAHRIADAVFEKLTNERGVASTRLAYVVKSGTRSVLWVSDADGENAQSALNSTEPIISPAWSPSGAQLAYVSFESRKPVIYVHDVATGRRRLLANFRGSNSAPRFSPDGKSIAMTLSRDGNSQIYVMDANGGDPRRVSQSSGIDTESVFAPDGKSIYFVSDRGGNPQIYRQPLSGAPADAQRVTFNGNYNISPAPSPDGRLLAHITRGANGFKLHVTDLASGQSTPITDTNADERPSYSPNGRLIVFATRVQGDAALMTTTVDGKVKSKLGGGKSDIREPDWGPFLR